MWDKLGPILGLAIGCYFIFFRKSAGNLMIRKQLEERTTPKAKEYQHQLKEMQLEGILHKIVEIAVMTVGVGFVLLSIPELFFPQARKYFTYLLVFFMLSLFAAVAAALVEFTLISRFLFRNVRKYTRERYGDWYQSVQNSSGSDKLNAVKSGPTDDPILHTLRKRATIYTVVCFVALFIIFLLVFYTIYRVTS